ncbi:beta-mannosidase-like [Eurosta solidaginis]|uniref:beta-mannosidase-like n=1 Tax=Eurosta solidaginis TaxID=178769 RepID=UPI0035313ECE
MLRLLKVLPYFVIAFFVITNVPQICCDKVAVMELTNFWTLTNQNGSISKSGIKIPTSVYAALSGTYGDVLKSKNDVNLRWIALDNWTFTNNFTVDPEYFAYVNAVNLTLHGIDTVATVRLNGREIGFTDNMFRSYRYDVLQHLRQENVLEIEIISPIWVTKKLADIQMELGLQSPPACPSAAYKGECHRNMLRKMQMSFGSEVGPAVPSMGIWKVVSLEYYEVAILRNVDVAVEQNKTHWIMDVDAFFNTVLTHDFFCNISCYAPELLDEYLYAVGVKNISYTSLNVNFKVPVPKESVELWWPNGYGSPILYPIIVRATCWADTETPKLRAKTLSQIIVKIGFRTIELIEELQEGQGRTFYFKVNGVPIFIKGAVYLPAHILPEDYSNTDAVEYIMNSAYEANMNMIRVWGGGLYESKDFYNFADRIGLLIWQDMTFTNSAYPASNAFTESVRTETAQNAKQLASHPSFVFMVTNDEVEHYLMQNKLSFTNQGIFERLENEYNQLFQRTIKSELNIISRPNFNPRPGPMISTPSKGIEENKMDLPLDSQSVNYGDVHFCAEYLDGFDPDIYPRARFISKYGFQSLPAMSSWNASMNINESIAELIKHRQHNSEGMKPMLQLIERHFPFKSSRWEHDIETLIYFSQLTQALAAKTATELFRSQRVNYRTMGVIYWHLNDVWVAPTWSMIDYYGNYKLLYYWSKQFFTSHSIIALYDANNKRINITLLRDAVDIFPDARKYTEVIKIYYWNKLLEQKRFTRDEILETNSAVQRSVPINEIISTPFTVNNSFMELELRNSQNEIVAATFFLASNLRHIEGILDPKITAEISWKYCNEGNISPKRIVAYSLTVHISSPALFVFIQIVHPKIKRYKLSQNGFIQTVPVKIVHLEIEHSSQCMVIENENIKVYTLNKYILANSDLTLNNKRRKKRSDRSRMDL